MSKREPHTILLSFAMLFMQLNSSRAASDIFAPVSDSESPGEASPSTVWIVNAGSNGANQVLSLHSDGAYYSAFQCTGEPDTAFSYSILKTGSQWQIKDPSGSILYIVNAETPKPPDSEWEVSSGNAPAPTLKGDVSLMNIPPTASNVNFTGDLTTGQTLSGSYDYSDPGNDEESGSVYKWYRSDDNTGSGETLIPEATGISYTLGTGDIDKYISFEVIPHDGSEAGNAVKSTRKGPVTLPLVSQIEIIDSIYCYNISSGSLRAVVGGGTEPYSYSWTPPADDEDTLTGLAAGSYICIVTDALGHKDTSEITLTQPDSIQIIVSKINVSCRGGSDGSIDISVTGGKGEYNYQWSGSSNAETEDLSSIPAGTYTVEVTDENNCTETKTIEIAEPNILKSGKVGLNSPG